MPRRDWLTRSGRWGGWRIPVVAGFALAMGQIFTGCGSMGRKEPTLAVSLPAPAGTVVMVEQTLKFALVDFGSLRPPAPGTALKCFSGGLETGILAVGPHRRGVFLVADVVSGNPGVGDKAYR